jgi:hypothetical protein
LLYDRQKTYVSDHDRTNIHQSTANGRKAFIFDSIGLLENEQTDDRQDSNWDEKHHHINDGIFVNGYLYVHVLPFF